MLAQNNVLYIIQIHEIAHSYKFNSLDASPLSMRTKKLGCGVRQRSQSEVM